VSFVIALLGVSALWLFVPNAEPAVAPSGSPVIGKSSQEGPMLSRRFVALAICGTVLALATISDGFLYLMLQQKSGTSSTFVPLFFVVTAATYMLFALPVGLAADHLGRRRIFLAGYAVLAFLYVVLLMSSTVSIALQIGCLVLLGLYYAGTEGVLMAAASSVIPSERRTTGLAVIATCIGLGKLVSSLLFGWAWQTYGAGTSLALFAAALPVVLLASAALMRRMTSE
jgi:MFS family permease